LIFVGFYAIIQQATKQSAKAGSKDPAAAADDWFIVC
jgi:hypothetical protein